MVPHESVAKLRGATVDWSEDRLQQRVRGHQPEQAASTARRASRPADEPGSRSAPSALPVRLGPRPRAGLDTDLARRVIAVLDRDVNPSIASHGGHAELAGIEGATAYLRLGGGCQGCGMATVTLSQGIEVAITQAVPEIDRVVDVTDHASGTNPYFEPAKK